MRIKKVKAIRFYYDDGSSRLVRGKKAGLIMGQLALGAVHYMGAVYNKRRKRWEWKGAKK